MADGRWVSGADQKRERVEWGREYHFGGMIMAINTIIVDDEKPAREELAFLLKGFPEINLVGQGKNGIEAVNLIKEHAPDLLFSLDVQMPGLDGFGVLKKLVERKLKVPHIVFATAFDHYAVQAFDVNAVDYVLKPFDKARIAKAIQAERWRGDGCARESNGTAGAII